MRLLLFFISLFFSLIFYWFYHITNWLNFYWLKNLWILRIESLSWNLLIETFIFLFFWVILFLYFSPDLKLDRLSEKILWNLKKSYFIFYFLLIISIFSGRFHYDTFVLFSIIFFIFSDICFNFLSNLPYFKEQKNNLRYFWLFLNFSSTFISLYYLFNLWFSLFLVLILGFNVFFNYIIYKKYWNIASKLAYLSIIIFVLLFLIFRVLFVLNIKF